jgi:DNA-binding MarR family transcriptional regulator
MNQYLKTAYSVNQAAYYINGEAEKLLQNDYGISYRQFLALVGLSYLQPCSQKQLAEFTQVTSAGMLHLLSGLESKEWISKQYSTGNRRMVSISLTPAGINVFEDMNKRLGAKLDSLVRLSNEELSDLQSLLARFTTQD